MIWRFVDRRRFYQSLCAGACSGSHLREVLGRFRKSRQREIPDGNSTASVATEASAAGIFAGMIMDGGPTFAEFERSALSEGHAIMARAMRRTLEHLDAALCAKTDGGGRRPRRRRALHQRMPERPATCCVRPGDQARRLDRGRRGVRLGRRNLVWRSRALPPPPVAPAKGEAKAVAAYLCLAIEISTLGENYFAIYTYSGKSGWSRKVVRENTCATAARARLGTSGLRP